MNEPKVPYKFNSAWLKDADYIKLVTDYWKSHPPTAGGNIAEGFSHNLSELKRLSKIWAHNKRLMDEQTLGDTKAEIADLEDEHGRGYTTPTQKERFTTLVAQRGKLLKDKEESWRL